MSRPEDVSQEAWDAALIQARALFTDWEGPGADDIARAITAAVAAEREACAQYINDLAEQWRATGTVTGNTFGNIYDEEADAIRARSTP